MKKILIVLLFIICIVFGCISCAYNRNYENYTPTYGSMFICVESYTDPYLGDVKILVDKETRIMYIRYYTSEGDGKYSGMTALYDSDGNPKKYNGVIAD